MTCRWASDKNEVIESDPNLTGSKCALGSQQAEHCVPRARALQQEPGREHRLRGQQPGGAHGGCDRRRQEGQHPPVHHQLATGESGTTAL